MTPELRVQKALALYRQLLDCEIGGTPRDAERIPRLVHAINNHLTVLPEWARRAYYEQARGLRRQLAQQQREGRDG